MYDLGCVVVMFKLDKILQGTAPPPLIGSLYWVGGFRLLGRRPKRFTMMIMNMMVEMVVGFFDWFFLPIDYNLVFYLVSLQFSVVK